MGGPESNQAIPKFKDKNPLNSRTQERVKKVRMRAGRDEANSLYESEAESHSFTKRKISVQIQNARSLLGKEARSVDGQVRVSKTNFDKR